MAKQSNQKLKLLYLLRILVEHTDAERGLTLSEISSELAKYNISAARKSLYDDIEALRVFGVDVCVKRDRYVKYYIGKREFSFTELKYIINALEGFSAVDPETARRLIEKIIRMWGEKGRSYGESVESVVAKMPKMIVEDFDRGVYVISSAIASGKKIRCKEFTWNPQKQRTLKNDGRAIIVTPIRLICEERYLLYAFDGSHVRELFVDRLIEVEMLEESAASSSEYKAFLDESILELYRINVRIEFDSLFAGEVFEHFGLGTTVLSVKENSFEFSVKVKLDDSFYFWLFKNSNHIRKISPEKVRDEYKERILMALEGVENI